MRLMLTMNFDKSNESSEDPAFREHLLDSSRRIAYEMGLQKSAVEDIYQSVLANLSRLSTERMKQIDNLQAYASKMARNEAIKFHLKNRHLQVQIDSTSHSFSDQAQSAKRVEDRVLLKEIWKHLDPQERQILQLIIFGYGAKEIANRLEITHDSARQKIFRLRKSLREFVFEGA